MHKVEELAIFQEFLELTAGKLFEQIRDLEYL